jgi:DNA-binding YbaB/EbfC family protein
MNIQEMMRQAQRMQKKMKDIQDEMGKQEIEGSAGGGMVVVTASGRGEVLRVKIEKDVVDPNDVEMLQDLVTAAANQALTRAKEAMEAEMGKVTGGLSMPGMF